MNWSKTAAKPAMLVAVVMAVCSSLSVAHAVAIDWVTVGNPGNANDTTGYGAVGYGYQIGKYDVTIQQYTDFLNAAAKSDPYSLYDSRMASNLNIAGISQTGSNGSYVYSVIGSGNRPITIVNWFDAARFANWMQNGQGSGSTETGAYTLVGGQTSGVAPAKNPGATFYIPTENEWYKAAYYSPLLNSGAGGYYAYASQSNTAPGNVVGSTANQANYRLSGSIYSVTQSSDYSTSQNYLTDVGAFTNSMSYYGTFDQGGNVYQWNDLDGTTTDETRGARGGSWGEHAWPMSSARRATNAPVNASDGVGFRLASPVAPVPEPSTYAMALAGLACGGFSMWRQRKRA
ncbi:MAG: SUMF1/EgtB/PvdO family nonheme iron enzyme [Pirellulales bacterium]